MLLSTLRHSKLSIDGLTLTPRTCSPWAAFEGLELDKAIEPRPHPQPRKFHSLDVGPEVLESGNVAQGQNICLGYSGSWVQSPLGTSSYEGLVLQSQFLDFIAYLVPNHRISVSISESIPDKAKTEAIKSHILKS